MIEETTQEEVGEGIRFARTQESAFGDDSPVLSLMSIGSEEVGWVDGSEPVANATYEPVDGRV